MITEKGLKDEFCKAVNRQLTSKEMDFIRWIVISHEQAKVNLHHKQS